MYLSHAVRRIREDPMADEDATLVVDLGDRSVEEVTETVEALGGEVEAELPFDSCRIRLAQEAVDEFCDLDGLAAVETADVVGYGGDVGEDVE